MSKQYIESLESVFNETSPPSPESLKSLMDETIHFFQEIKSKIESHDPTIQEGAFQEMILMRHSLEQKMKTFCARVGIDPSQMKNFTQNLSPTEWSSLEETKDKLKSLNDIHIK
ncbi:MAG: hypothetical protein HY861_03145 [Chlamydiia bacterium]|nr:hypothetical protein [Chlamydiia bacterium]